MSSIQDNEFLVKVGARGDHSLGPEDWDEGGFGKVRKILISHGDAINSIQVGYFTDGSLVLAHRHGGSGDKFDCVNLESWESLTMMKGYYGPLRGHHASVVRSLTFGTNAATYGPFGIEQGTPFCFNIPSGVSFGGFHGRSDSSFLRAIGMHVKPMASYHYWPKPGWSNRPPGYYLPR
ncbi:jacalin-related lectin 3 [Cocos nucifera]|uniref:Jacalin-related lectin 3 n=1 Tax=Cocos nucifera TaxID=13894 RepID=A0A8K0IHW8_COCNU|nr:jacalin-related lectin 3 [Cocos nucifera]